MGADAATLCAPADAGGLHNPRFVQTRPGNALGRVFVCAAASRAVGAGCPAGFSGLAAAGCGRHPCRFTTAGFYPRAVTGCPLPLPCTPLRKSVPAS